MSAQTVELKALTGLRGVLSLWVVVLHTALGMGERGFSIDARFGTQFANIIYSGVLAVDCFFILSGFVLAYVYAHQFKWGDWSFAPRFMALRLARIYPVHILVLIVYLAIYLSGIDWPADHCGNPFNRDLALCDRFSASGFIESALLINSWGIDPQVSWNISAWSISSEWFAYLAFPLLIVAAGMFAPLAAFGAAMLVLAIMIPILFAYVPIFRGLGDDYGLLRVVPEFICGLLLARVHTAEWFERVPWPAIATLSLLTGVGLIAIGFVPIATVFCLAILVLALSSTQTSIVSSFLSSARMQWLGRISFSLYMTDLIVLEALGYAETRLITGNPLKHVWQAGLTILLATVICTIAGAIVYRYVESPARDWTRRRIMGNGSRQIF